MIMAKSVTQILESIEQGDGAATADLLPLVYQELRRLAESKLSRERDSPSIQPTLLVHEAYLRLVDQEQQPTWNSRGHFFAAASQAMRRILVESARRKQSKKRGGGMQRVSIDQVDAGSDADPIDVIALDEALTLLAEKWPEHAHLVNLRYFAGLTISDASVAMGISHATAERHWSFARAFLFDRLSRSD